MGRKGEKKKRAPMGLGRWIVLVICAIVFAGCLGYLGLYVKDKLTAQGTYEELKTIAEDGGTDNRNLSQLWGMNNDFVGWLTVDGTKIDYPVMQTPDDPEYYLHNDFRREYSESGTPFLDANSVVRGKDKTWNWFIYGHNMKFGTMFHDLLKYDEKEFWEEHRYFTFDVYYPEKEKIDYGKYEIVAACYSRIYPKSSEVFKFYTYAGYDDEETFNEFIHGIKSECQYDTGIVPEYGDQLITLSTCAYHTTEGRFYIVGRRIE